MILSNRVDDGDDQQPEELDTRSRKRAVTRQAFVQPMPTPRIRRPAVGPAVLITGGAGFLGANLAHRLLSQRRRVIIVDTLARPGAERNVQFLRQQHADRLRFETADVRDSRFMRELAASSQEIYHLACTPGEAFALADPVNDFDINVRGTLSVLEAARAASNKPRLVVASTAKVYGTLESLKLKPTGKRLEPAGRGEPVSINEEQPLRFCTPHACSRGSADQYALDYARTFSLPVTVLRFSSVVGRHQSGSMDQHWVANLLCRVMDAKPVTITGDGKQVRDLLHVDDAVDALIAAMEQIDKLAGQPFNLGGGPERSRSVLEVLEAIDAICGSKTRPHFEDARPGDPPYFVADTTRFASATGWSAKLSVDETLASLHNALTEQRKPAPSATSPAAAPAAVPA
jgi:CDP-paratose 2-epimerase